MLNFSKFIEIVISFQSILISSMIPVFISIPIIDKSKNFFEIPITWQIPTLIFLSILYKPVIVNKAFSIYLLIGLFFLPIFHQGGSLGYLLTPNFGYLIGMFPLIKIINNLNNKNRIKTFDFIKNGILAIFAMHLTGIIYILIQLIFYQKIEFILYNISNYTFGKIGYHLLMLCPLLLVIKTIEYIKKRV